MLSKSGQATIDYETPTGEVELAAGTPAGRSVSDLSADVLAHEARSFRFHGAATRRGR